MILDWNIKPLGWGPSLPQFGLGQKFNYQLGRVIVGLGAAALLNLDIVKKTIIPEGPKIFAANHPTTTDPGLLTLLSQEPMSILITEALFKVPVFGIYLANAGHITVLPGNGRIAFEQARAVLLSGYNIGIFTEGSLSPENGGTMPPRTGTVRLALSTGVPVIPVGIHLDRSNVHYMHTRIDGKTEVSRWCLGGPYAMTVGSPLALTGDTNIDSAGYNFKICSTLS